MGYDRLMNSPLVFEQAFKKASLLSSIDSLKKHIIFSSWYFWDIWTNSSGMCKVLWTTEAWTKQRILYFDLFIMTSLAIEKLSAHHSTNSRQWGVWSIEKKWKKDFKKPQVVLPWSLRNSNLPRTASMVSPTRMVSKIFPFSS